MYPIEVLRLPFSIIGQYAVDLGFADLILRTDYVYQSQEFYTRENFDVESSDAYGILNAQIGLENLLNGKINLVLFGTNLTDENYVVYAEDLIGLGTLYVPGVPRLMGVKLKFNNVLDWWN